MRKRLTNFKQCISTSALIILLSFPSFAQRIAGGSGQSVAICNDSVRWAWGENSYGQLGRGGFINSAVPVLVSGPSGAAAVSAGASHCLSLMNDARVLAWGWNQYGQLGDSTLTNRDIPVSVINLTGVVSISAGYHFSLAAKSNGTAWAWGNNEGGQLGNNTTDDQYSPTQVLGLTGITKVAGGYNHALFLKNTGVVWSVGANANGQLGNNSLNSDSNVVQVNSLTNVIAISAGFYHSMALKSDGTVWTWGDNSSGQLGDNSNTTRKSPVQVTTLSGIIAISAGFYHSLALKSDSTVWAWGDNVYGQIGDGSNTQRKVPVKIGTLSGVKFIGAGYFHSLVTKSDGTSYTCGWNNFGQLGDGTSGTGTNKNIPVKVLNLCAATGGVTILSNVSCNGGATGSATVTPGSGTAPFTYYWNSSPPQTTATATGLPAGTYTVTITDANSITSYLSVVITEPPVINLSASSTNLSCFGASNGTATAVASGGAGVLKYEWNTAPIRTTASISGLTTGTYVVTVTDLNNCTKTASVAITQPPIITISTTQTNVTPCNGGNNGSASASASGGTGVLKYSWNTAPVQTTATITGLSAGVYVVTVTDANNCTNIFGVSITQPTGISLTASPTNVSCNGANDGSATAIALGGTGAIKYSWNTAPVQTMATATGLTPGSYTVVVTDANNCTKSTSVVVTQPTILALSSSQSNVSCNGGNNGSATALPSGGAGGYKYSWSNGATTQTAASLIAGSYSVIVTDANNCTKATSVIITQPSAITLSTSQTNVTCNGSNSGSATASASGGTGTLKYLWSTTPVMQTTAMVTGLTAGTYSVTVTDANNCTKASVVTITQPPGMTLSTFQSNVSCNGGNNGNATVSASGGAGALKYSWNTAPAQTTVTATGLVQGTYSVTVTDANNCSKTASVSITQPLPITLSTSHANLTCNGDNEGFAIAIPSGGTGAFSYLWSNGATTKTATGLPAGTYTVTVTDANNCTKTATAVIQQPTPIILSTNSTNASCGNSDGSATVTASGGTGNYFYSWSNGATTQSATSLAAGVYVVIVNDEDACSSTATVIISNTGAPTISISSQTGVTCVGGNDGGAKISANGGSKPYTYSWNTVPAQTSATATGLSEGTYYVYLTDDAGCIAIKSVTVTALSPMSITVSPINVSCNGGTSGRATATVSGGTGTLKYSWNTAPSQTTATATGLAAGSYAVVVTDANNCTKTASASITQPSAITVNTSQTNLSCNGGNNGSAIASASGGTGTLKYSWSNGATTAATGGLSAGTYVVTVTDANNCTKTASVTITQPPAITVNITQANIKCNGGNNGSATASASGGTGALFYTWSTGATVQTISGLSAGSYSVTVTDAINCTKLTNVIITQPSALTLNTSQTNLSCNGVNNGSATVSASGGTIPFKYSWNTAPVQTNATATGLTAGSYVVTVTDSNNCSKTTSITITQPPAITLNTSQTNISCNGSNNGSATASASGGTGALKYSWNTSPVQTTATITGLSSGTYTVVVTDANNCTKASTVIITQPLAITLNTSQVNVSCNGSNNGSATALPAGGAGGYKYSWNTLPVKTTATAAGLAPGSYTVVVTDANNCTKSASVTITQPSTVTLSVSSTNVTCNAANNGTASAIASGGTGLLKYSWNTFPVKSTATVTGLSAGTYLVVVTDANNCTKSGSVVITQPPAIILSTSQTNISCNGANTGSASASASGGTGALKYSWSNGATTSSVSGLNAGFYTVTITDVINCTKTSSVTINQPPAITVSTSKTNVSCNGGNNGSITASASGGTGALKYSWNTVPVQTTATAAGLTAGSYTVTITDANNCTKTSGVTITQPSAITLNTSQTNVTCNAGNNGSATASASGGTGVLKYVWSNGATTSAIAGLGEGTYTVTVTDVNNCTKTATVIITQPSPISITTGSNNASCGINDGSATVNASGGTGSLHYSWSNGATTQTVTALAAGAYGVTVSDANGCTKTASVNISNTGSPVISVSSLIKVTCSGGNDGSATVTATGGVPPYTYSWGTSPVQTTATATGLSEGTYDLAVTDSTGCTAIKSISVTALSPMSVQFSEIDPSCNGGANGSAIATVTGGTGTLKYLWSNGATTQSATSLIAGTYNITVTDANNCIKTSSVILSEPSAITISSFVTNVSCNGGNNGTATANASGGTGMLKYLWNNGATTQTVASLIAGTYSVTVTDANNCVKTTNVTIGEPPVITLSATGNDVLCNNESNGTAIALASGGTGILSYGWSNGLTGSTISGLNAGTYTVTVTDANNCTSASSVIIDEPSAVSISITPSKYVCSGSCTSITAIASGGHGNFSYSWQPLGQTLNSIVVCPTDPTIYIVTATDSTGCFGKDSTIIDIHALPAVSVSLYSDTVCTDTPPFMLTGGSPAGGTFSGSFVTAGEFDPAAAGIGVHEIIYEYTDSNSCSNSDTVYLTVDICTGVQQNDLLPYLIVYPNPSDGAFTIQNNSGGELELRVVNILDETILSLTLTHQKTKLDLQDQPNGIYFLLFKTQEGTQSKRIIISR